MMPVNAYVPVRAGFAQREYVDQQATGLAGQLLFASDVDLVDAYIVDPSVGSNGLEAGLGVIEKITPNPAREGLNPKYAALPAAGTTAAQFAGISVRNQQMNSNANGNACWFGGETCNVLRAGRVGGRILAQLSNGQATIDARPFLIISDTTNHGKPIGSFSGIAIGADTVELTNVKWAANGTSADQPVPVAVELGV